MDATPGITKTFNCFFFDLPGWRASKGLQLPMDQYFDKYVDRVSGVLQEEGFLADSSTIELYKPPDREYTTAEMDDWRASVGNPKKAFQRLPPRRFLSSYFDDDSLKEEDTVHIVVFASWRKVYLNYLLFDAGNVVYSIGLPANQEIQDCSTRIAKALQEKGCIALGTSVVLYKAPPGLLVHTAIKVEWRVTFGDPHASFKLLAPSLALHESFSREELDDRHTLHVIVEAQPSRPTGISSEAEATDSITPLREFCATQYRKFCNAYTVGAKTPSTAAKSTEFRKNQRREIPIYDGRTATGTPVNSSTIAMPPSLYHPVFEIWRKEAFDRSLEPPSGVVARAAKLMQKASVLYENERKRSSALWGLIEELLGQPIDSIVNTDKTASDGRISVRLQRGGKIYNAPTAIVEEKNEAAEGTDAMTQAVFSTIRAWYDPKLDNLCNLTCCPTFLLGFSGCQLTIAAAVITDKCIVERLATLWIARSSIFDQNRIMSTARVFYALSRALKGLAEWYQSEAIVNRPLYDAEAIAPLNNHPRFFPHANQYTVEGGVTVKFEYLHPLESSSLCVTFLAQATEGSRDKLVVKFTQRYCSALHILLANRNMAPALRYCGKIDENTPYENWEMVVMDYYNGSQATEEHAIREAVEEAVAVGHTHDFVFGDIRRPNVLVGKADGQLEVKLIDFDWAGEAGIAQYPPDMSDNDDLWVDGMTPLAVIKKEHDLAMIEKWFPN